MTYFYRKLSPFATDEILSLEWLDTNDIGGYASSTISGCNTRKYHGLLVASAGNPAEKSSLLSRLEETVVIGDERYDLQVNQYRDCLQQDGMSLLREFAIGTQPRAVYRLGTAEFIRETLMVCGENTVLARYSTNAKDIKLRIRPLLSCRDIHGLTHANDLPDLHITDCKCGKVVKMYPGMPTLFIETDADFEFIEEPLWYYNFEYEVEKERGYDYLEDLFSPGVFTLSSSGTEIILSCSTIESRQNSSKKWRQEIKRRENVAKSFTGTELQQRLKRAALDFIRRDQKGKAESVIAGFHWFGEWGRDAMIALPGITLFSGLEQDCLSILKHFGANIHKGLIPNFIGTSFADNAYNSVDASLWFAWAVQQYLIKTSDIKAVRKYLWPVLQDIYQHYKKGTLHNIKMTENGLIYAGSKDVNLTWMDAVVDGAPVTPRYGLQVEINALWFNMISFMCELASKFKEPLQDELAQLIEQSKQAFCQTFWDEELGYLKDFVNEHEADVSIRPNQIFAVSLPYSPLTKKMMTSIVNVVTKELLTPYGLRTLSPNDPQYIGCYGGSQATRDRAYHNGTVWPWLLGHFGEALLKITDRQKMTEMLQPSIRCLAKHLDIVGIGGISEVFDGNKPWSAGGCVGQAWSIAELLRLTYIMQL